MAKPGPKVIVIDASITNAAGDVSQHPTSRSCREFLIAFDNNSYQMVMTKPIGAEWDKHQTNFARRWRASMMSRKRIELVKVNSDHRRLNYFSHLEVSPKQIATMEKDCHLIEAALASDERVTSLDDEVRGLFRTHHVSIPGIGRICWVNPNKPDENAIPWLQRGAPAERHRTLAALPKTSKKK